MHIYFKKILIMISIFINDAHFARKTAITDVQQHLPYCGRIFDRIDLVRLVPTVRCW